ncbi:MAG TPA: sigma-70 family RNA polymerase sigma factor [Gemmatimonadaceae bacterium]|nr:sigma-70 family RNA polymerase sigma factor [Gemmatimonadaceae bacterium]
MPSQPLLDVPLRTNDGESSAALVRAAQDGDRQAFETLYDRYVRLVHAVLLGTLDSEDASDVAQDVFFRAWQQLNQLRDPEAFGPWLTTIARNAARMRHRAEPRHVPLTPSLVAGATSVEAKLDAQHVLAQLQSLPAKFRDPLMLRLVEGMSGVEIAALTGLTHGTVRVYLHEGMRLLRARLQSDAVDHD